MDKRPLFLGKGRGRGRGNVQNSTKASRPDGGAGGNTRSLAKGDSGSSSAVIGKGKPPKASEVSRERMEKAEKIKESAKRYIERAEDEFEESSEDEEVNDSEILSKTLKNYRINSQGT